MITEEQGGELERHEPLTHLIEWVLKVGQTVGDLSAVGWRCLRRLRRFVTEAADQGIPDDSVGSIEIVPCTRQRLIGLEAFKQNFQATPCRNQVRLTGHVFAIV